MITVGNCLKKMHAGEVFSLKVVAYDERRPNKCGRVLEYPEATLVWGDGGSDRKGMSGERQMTALEKRLSDAGMQKIRRDPNHADWYTRNLRILQGGQPTAMIVKIHPPLIIEFNRETTCP